MKQIKTPNILSIFYAVAILSLLLSLPSTHIYAVEKIVAIVNDEIITQKDLDEFVAFMRMQLSRDYKGSKLEEKIKELKNDLINKLIEDRLIIQQARKENIPIDNSRIEARINDLRKRYPSEAEFQADFLRAGISQKELEEKIKEQFLMYAFVEQKIKAKIIVNPEEISSFYNKNNKDFMAPEEREIDIITLDNNDLATSFSYNLRTGQKLEDLAARYPITVNTMIAARGKDLKKEIEDVVFKLGAGEVSAPIKVDDKYYVIKVKNIIPPRQYSFSEVQENIYNFLFEQKMEQSLTKWLDETKKQSYIKIN